jgi:hypothetical protein
LHFFSESSTKEPIKGQELHADAIEVQITSEGNTQEIFINVKGNFKYTRKANGEPPEGFNTPPPIGLPSGISNLPESLEPSSEPDLNIMEPNSQPLEPIVGIDPELEPNPTEPEPDPEEPDPEPEPIPDEPDPEVKEPEPDPEINPTEPNLEPEPEV